MMAIDPPRRDPGGDRVALEYTTRRCTSGITRLASTHSLLHRLCRAGHRLPPSRDLVCLLSGISAGPGLITASMMPSVAVLSINPGLDLRSRTSPIPAHMRPHATLTSHHRVGWLPLSSFRAGGPAGLAVLRGRRSLSCWSTDWSAPTWKQPQNVAASSSGR